MSDDLPEKLPGDEPRGTNAILERILEEVLANRATLARLESKVDELRSELAGTREVFRQELGLETRNVRSTLVDIERRLRALEDRQPV